VVIGDEIQDNAFTPDDRFVVIWNGGKLQKVSVTDAVATAIPMTVHVVRGCRAVSRLRIDSPLNVRALRWPTLSPDRKTSSLRSVALERGLPSGKPTRLTKSEDFEFHAAFQRRGTRVYQLCAQYATGGTLAPGTS